MTAWPRPAPADRRKHRWQVPREDTGSVAIEVALSVPLALLLLSLIATAFHLSRATIDVNAAVAAGSRAASLADSAATATSAAQSAAAASLADQCAAVSVTVDTADFRRGGSVTVAVECTVTTRGLTGIDLPGAVTTSARSTSPVDVYRTVTP